MHIIEDDPFTRKHVTLEDLKVHANQLEVPGLEKRLGVPKPTEQSIAQESEDTNGLVISLGGAALNGSNSSELNP